MCSRFEASQRNLAVNSSSTRSPLLHLMQIRTEHLLTFTSYFSNKNSSSVPNRTDSLSYVGQETLFMLSFCFSFCTSNFTKETHDVDNPENYSTRFKSFFLLTFSRSLFLEEFIFKVLPTMLSLLSSLKVRNCFSGSCKGK